MTAFYKFTDTTGRYYPTLEINVTKNDVVDFAPLGGSPPDPDRWTTSTGPATVAPGSGYTYPGGAPTSPAPLLGPWVPNVAYVANQAVMSPSGTVLTRLSGGTSRATFDTTEAARWIASVIDSIAALTPSDGQALVWNTALGAWTIANPSGASQLAYAENNTAVTQAGINTNTATPVTGCTIVIPASTRPVYISGSLSFIPTAIAALCAVRAQLVEVNNGTDTPVTRSSWVTLTTGMPGGGQTATIGPLRLAATTARVRTFNLVLLPSSNATITIDNGAFADVSWLAAEAR